MALSGQKIVATAGTAEALGNQDIAHGLLVKALPTNSGLVYLGNDGVTSADGFPLLAGEAVIFEHVSNLSAIKVDAAVNGEGVAWIILGA